MKSTDERMQAVLKRAQAREAANRRRRGRIVAISGGALSVIAIVVLSFNLASTTTSGLSMPGGPLDLMGSVFSDSPVLGYIAVGLLGLVLGVAVTVLAYRLRHKHSPTPEDESSPDEESSDT